MAGAGDYVSPGFRCVFPDRHFPNLTALNASNMAWPYLRKGYPHTLYGDRRHPNVGFLSRDEAQLLHNLALGFQGKRALEIGCFMGWSTFHLAAAGVLLDTVDPIIADQACRESIVCSLTSGGLSNIRLIAGFSPKAIRDIAERERIKWSFMFIDGNHEGEAPRQDAEICHAYAEADALILFHDLLSPHVAAGLDWLKRKGWKTRIYDTVQIMGCAYRGGAQPVDHVPDPSFQWQRPEHLADFG